MNRSKEPSYVREARLAQQRHERRIPVQLEIGGLMEEGFDFSKRYKVEGYSGIAWRAHEYAEENIADWSDDEPEWIRDETRVVCIMVGDDRTFTFDVSNLTALEDDEYCPECGQIGCKANG